MKPITSALTLPAILLAGVLTVTACGTDEDAAAPATGGSVAPEDAAVESTSQDGSAVAEAHNEADVEFATGMIPHHAQAIEMAEMALAMDGSSVTELAEQIRAAQGPEIETLSQWLTAWGADVPATDGGHDMGSMDDMGGMMSAEDMESLTQMNGADFDVMWLEMMTEHHMGAIEMAETEVMDGQSPDAIALAQDIVESQQAEIEQMQEMLTSVNG